jgi:pSer/pThr/pTyr-binding forkhead associated (FHA) protein
MAPASPPAAPAAATGPPPGHIPAARRPWLDVDGHAYPLLGPVTVVGRGEDVDVVLDDPGVSRRHAEIRVTTDGPRLVAHLRDLGSTNGTFVDGSRVTGAVLSDGNGITMGRTRLTFRSGER